MSVFMDIREYKKNMREQVKVQRKELDAAKKKKLDSQIAARFLATRSYKKCQSLFCYVSTPIEVDTIAIINQAFADNKIVAVPRCIPNTRNMEFIQIKSFDDLERGTFGVLEPKLSLKTPFVGNSHSICIIPALMYDKSGYRLGYGGGYYDRYLAGFKGKTVGIIYSFNITEKLIHGKFDIPVSRLVTQNSIEKPKVDY